MQYRQLGASGPKVSVLSFGNWITGDDKESEKTQIELVKIAYDAGVNFFDTAELYGYGVAEEIMGKAIVNLKCKREDLVVSTKLYWGKSEKFPGVNCTGLSRKHLIEGMKASLKRLQLDYVDIVFCHRADPEISLEDVCKSMSWIVDQGYSIYWGTSEWPACLISAAIEICNRLGLNKPIAEQPQYSMVHRERFEQEYREIFEVYKYGTTIWSPLANGLLSGRFNDGVIDAESRLNKAAFAKMMFEHQKNSTSDIFSKLKKLAELAKEVGCSQAQLAILWVIANKDVSTCILGASKESQLKETLETVKYLSKWTPELNNKIDQILGNEVTKRMDFKAFVEIKNRRNLNQINL